MSTFLILIVLQGFRARGTDLSARIVSHRNLLGGNPGPNQLSSGIYVGNMSDDRMAFRDATNDGFGRKRRNVDTVQEGGTSGIQFCQDSGEALLNNFDCL